MKTLTKLVNRYCGVVVSEEQAERILASQLCPNQVSIAGSIKIPSTRPCLEGLGSQFPTIQGSPLFTGPIPTPRQMIPLPAGTGPENLKDKPPIWAGARVGTQPINDPRRQISINQAGGPAPVPDKLPAQDLLDTIEQNWVYIAGGLGVILVLSVLSRGKGRRR